MDNGAAVFTELSEITVKVLDNSLRDSTKKKYLPHWEKFLSYCRTHLSKEPQTVSVGDILNYFSTLLNAGKSFSTINTAKIAISNFIYTAPYKHLGEHPAVDKYFDGLFNLNPTRPKVSSAIWDVNIVFNYFKSLGNSALLSDKQLSQKLCLFLLLLGGQRVNTIHAFTVDRLLLTSNSATFVPDTVIKHQKKGNKMDSFTYRAYPDSDLCIVQCLKEYLHRRDARVAGEVKKLLITYGKPYKAASIDSIRRWIKDLFKDCNINFSPHSCRSANTSKALELGVDLQSVLKMACWKSCGTFYKHYKKDISCTEETNFNELLNNL